MAALDELINKIEDKELRKRILEETKKLRNQRKFGLVFEDHIPECTPLYGVEIRKGGSVALKNSQINDVFDVLSIEGRNVFCKNRKTGITTYKDVSELVAVSEFGDPIYPYLERIDSVCNAPDSDLWHTLIEADNYHALQLLEYLYQGKVDCIYIDPPYNTGDKKWKYNNSYVDGNDAYRHSKWLSFIEKRLKLAKKLLNPSNSVLIVTIDEHEYLHLGCLLEQMFPETRIQMVSSVINPSGVSRDNQFYRTDEYIFIVEFGNASPKALPLSDEWITAKQSGKDTIRWRPVRRQGSHDTRRDSPNQFYPIYVSKDWSHFIGTGESLPLEKSVDEASVPKDVIAVWPIKPSGEDGCWQIGQDMFADLLSKGYVKISDRHTLLYIARGEQKKITDGYFSIIGRNDDGSVIVNDGENVPFVPGTQWRISSHSARENGSTLLNGIFLDKRFSFPKSLYAVHDVIRFFVADKPNALIIDFFAGSGTTLHAVNLLNSEDGGSRRCIIVTNNEVSAEEAKDLTAHGFHPGDPEWEKYGVARYVTWPRTVCSIKGHDVNGNPLKGNYLGLDGEKDSGQLMSNGFKANCIYFKLGFLDKDCVALGRQLCELIPILWMKAGAIGKCPEIEHSQISPMLFFPKNKMSILVKESHYSRFVQELQKYPEIQTIFIITDSDDSYHEMIKNLSGKITYQLYRDYLENFKINGGDL